MPRLTQETPIKYSVAEVITMIMVERSLNCHMSPHSRVEIEDVPPTLLPEYVATMLRKMFDEQGYARPEWNEDKRQWELGNITFKAKTK